MNIQKKHIDSLYDIVFSILLFSLPLSMAVPNICLALLFLIFVIKYKTINPLSFFAKTIFILVFFFLIKALITHTFLANISFNKQVLTVLALSVFSLNIKNLTLVKLSFIFGVLTAVIISLFKVGIYYYNYSEIPFGNTIQSNQLLLIERPYFGFISALSIIISLQLKNQINRFKSFFLWNVGMLFLFIILISARLSLALVFIIFIITILTNNKLDLKKSTTIIILLAISLIAVVFANGNLKKRFHIQPTFQKTMKVFANYEPRIVIWDCTFDLISKKDYSFIFGYNDISNSRNKLVNCYANKIKNQSKKAYYLKKRFNTHSQFLDFLLNGGIIGLFLFVLCFVGVFYYQKYDIFTVLIVLSFIMFSLVENILWRQLGAYLFGIFMSFTEPFLNKKTA